MNHGSRRTRAWVVIALMSLLPLLLIVFLGSHGRPTSDDFCHIISGLEYGPWGNVQYWRDSYNGKYSYYFLHGLTAPLDRQVVGALVATIVTGLLIGFVWLIVAGQRLLGGQRLPLTKAFVLAASLVWLSIYGLPTQMSIYNYSAALSHTFPIAILVIALAAACAVAPRLQSIRSRMIACAIFAFVAFVNAGLSEPYAYVQLALFTGLMPAVLVLSPKVTRRSCLALNISGWASTILALLVMMTAPGVSRRLAEIDGVAASPLRSLLERLPESHDRVLYVFADADLNATFIGMLAISLFLMSAIRRPAISLPIGEPFQLARRPLLLCFLGQLMLLPLVWTQQSDNPLVFGRFSPAYMVIVAGQFLILLSLAASLRARIAINALLLNQPAHWMALPILTLGMVYILSGLVQFRNVDYRASIYISCTIFMLTMLLLWQFRSYFSAAGKSRYFAATIWLLLALAAGSLALAAVFSAIAPSRIPYYLACVSFALALSGFIFGAAIAFAINRASAAAPASRPLRALVYGCAIVAFAIWLSCLIGNARDIPLYQRFSLAWDVRHEQILASRDKGERLNEVPKLTVTVPIALSNQPHNDYWQSSCGSAEITALIEARYRA